MDTLKLIKINSQSIEFNANKTILAYEIFCETTQCTLNPFIKGSFKGPFKYDYVLNLTLIVMFEV